MSEKSLLQALRRKKTPRPPIWLMRQAGRYLPEYREIRARAAGFLELVYTPELAVEISLQPIRRFGFDACILFSDILVIPDALGQKVRFEENIGPLLTPCITDAKGLAELRPEGAVQYLEPVYETIRQLRKTLPEEVALIGFAGAPWTVATYMAAGEGSTDQAAARKWAYRNPAEFGALIDMLVQVTGDYLLAQIGAGAEAIQLFDSWAGSLPEPEFRKWCIEPAKALTSRIREKHPHIPIIGFPRGSGLLYRDFIMETGVQGISIDTAAPLDYARDVLQPLTAVQGNIDPLLIVAGGKPMLAMAERILKFLGNGPFIFNAGHGIVPETPMAHVEELVKFVRQWRQ